MKVEEIAVTKQEVESELHDLKMAMNLGYISNKNRLVKDLLAVYGHLKHGGKIVDVNDAFHKAGLDENDDPKLAIVRADSNLCYLYKRRNGAAIFSIENKGSWQVHKLKKLGDVELKPGTFQWKDYSPGENRRKTLVPFIPPRVAITVSTRIMPKHYHIIFEPEVWSRSTPRRAPRDPILGKMLTENMFGILATWDLTDLETKIVEGRL